MVSVVVLNYNGMGRNYLPNCLSSLCNQSYQKVQIIVVDNNSTDASVSFVESTFPDICLLKNSENAGFCKGNNTGYQAAVGDYILFANNDTVFAADCVEQLVNAMVYAPNIGVVSPKLIRPLTNNQTTPLLDSAGLLLKKDFTLRDRGFSEPDIGQFEQPTYLFSACGAAMFLRREAIESVLHEDGTVWDENFFAYYEDGDLGWRLQNKGWQCLYYPMAIVEHHRGGSSPPSFFNKPDKFKIDTIKNRYLMIIKNASIMQIIQKSPHLLIRELLIWGYAILHPKLLIKLVQALYKTVPAAILERRRTGQLLGKGSVFNCQLADRK